VTVQCVDVGSEGQGNDVHCQSVDDRSGLLPRAAVRLVDYDLLTCFGFVLFNESLIALLVELAGRIVGNIQQTDRPTQAGAWQNRKNREEQVSNEDHARVER